MNQKERLEKLEKLARLEFKQIEPMYYRFQDKSVEQIAEILKKKYPDRARHFDAKKVWYRFTTIYKALGIEVEKIEGGEKENEEKKETILINEYSPIFMEFFQSEDDLKRWGQIRAEMLRQAEELRTQLNQKEGNRKWSVHRLFWPAIAVLLFTLCVFAVFQLNLVPFFVVSTSTATPTHILTQTHTDTPTLPPTSTLTPTLTLTPTQTASINEVVEDFEDNIMQGFHIEENGNSNWEVKTENGKSILEVSNDDSSTAHIDIPPSMFSNGSIEFGIRFYEFPATVTDDNEDWGSVDLHFRVQPDGEESYVLTLRPPLEVIELYYVRADGEWEWIEGGEYHFRPDRNDWYSMRLDLQEDQISVYLDGNLIFEVTDNRLDTGELLFYVRPYTTIQVDYIRVQEEP